MRKFESKPSSKKAPPKAKARQESENVLHMRSLAHDLSNALEAILQASYLLSQSKISGNERRWVQLIDTSSQDAARINRELRKLLRGICGED